MTRFGQAKGINLVFLLSLLLLTACGGGDDGGGVPSGGKTDGRSVSSADGKAVVTIPSGAISDDTNISIGVASNPPSGYIGKAYRFSPDGLAFLQPVTIQISYDSLTLPSGTIPSELVLGKMENGRWVGVPGSTVNTTTGVVSGTTSSFSVYGIVVALPEAPTGVFAVGANSQVTLGWDEVSGATSYDIYWNTTGGVTRSDNKIPNVTSPYVHSGPTVVINGMTYFYIVTASNSIGESSSWTEVSASAFDLMAKPDPPQSFQVQEGCGQITLSWNAVEGATSYNLYWSETSGMAQSDHVIPDIPIPLFTHTGLSNGTTYFYVITSYNRFGEGLPSVEIFGTQDTIPVAPLNVTPIGEDAQVTLTWDEVDGATFYNIYWNNTGSVTTGNNRIFNVKSPPHTHTDLTNGQTYYYALTAENCLGESDLSIEDSATPMAP